MQFKTSSSCHLLNTSMRACTQICVLYRVWFLFGFLGKISVCWISNLIRKMKIRDFSYIISDHLIIQSNCRTRASTSMRSDHISRVGIADILARGPLGPGPLGPCLRTTRTVRPDHSDRVSWTWIEPMKQDNSALCCNYVNIKLINNTLKCIYLFHVFQIKIWGRGFRTWLIIYKLMKVR